MGATLALLLSDLNKEVTIVDQNENSFKKLSKAYNGNTYLGNGMDLDILEAINIKDSDLILVATECDNTNIFISMVAKDIYHTKYIFSRLYDDELTVIFKGTNIQSICPPKLSINALRAVFNEGGDFDENINH